MGGQTYFSEPAGNSKRVPSHRVLNPDSPVANSTLETVLDNSPRESWLHHNGSWQRALARQCFGKRGDGLSVYPKKGEAVLFYSQQPDGNLDRSSLHAGCPGVAVFLCVTGSLGMLLSSFVSLPHFVTLAHFVCCCLPLCHCLTWCHCLISCVFVCRCLTLCAWFSLCAQFSLGVRSSAR